MPSSVRVGVVEVHKGLKLYCLLEDLGEKNKQERDSRLVKPLKRVTQANAESGVYHHTPLSLR